MKHKALIELARHRRLLLGSGSPRRIKLLSETGINFRQKIPRVDESALPGEEPFAFALRLAKKKAASVAVSASNDEVVLSGDTVVILDNTILGKPGNEQEAFDTLDRLKGKQHVVCTALALADHRGPLCSGVEKAIVVFNQIPPERIWEYIATGEPMDKAGAYGIQGMGGFLVDTIEGRIDNIIGLPCTLLDRLARETLRKLRLDTDC